MCKFNDETILTGYIKQLLHSFNLPSCKVFNSLDDMITYYDNNEAISIVKNYYNNSPYIVQISNKKVINSKLYQYNNYYPNITKTLTLCNGLYDSKTHIYLGDYLRFLRDYLDINLMSLYNCYSNITFTDKKYKYIRIPIKYNNTYTIAFTGKNYSYYLGYDRTLDNIKKYFTDNISNIAYITSDFKYPIKINTPKINNKLFDEKNYSLILRVELTNLNKLVVLEGDYKCNSDALISTDVQNHYKINNILNTKLIKIQGNFDKDLQQNISIEKYLNNFELLSSKMNNNESQPFAKRLIEYLSGNAITNNDKISKNIYDAKYKAFTRYTNDNIRRKIISGYIKLDDHLQTIDRLRFLDVFYQADKHNAYSKDLLGYVDKDIEFCLDDKSRDNCGGK